MKFLAIYCALFASFCVAYKEELGELTDLLNDPNFSEKLIVALEKRLSQPATNKHKPSGDCKYSTNQSTIIKTQASINNGAIFIGSPTGISKEQCVRKCCDNENCTVAIVKQTDSACYLFNCGSPSKCLFSSHPDFAIVNMMGPHAGIPAAARKEQESHASALESLATTKKPSTPTPTRTPAPLFGSCKESKDCTGSYTECIAEICLCQKGYHEQDGMCQKAKADRKEESTKNQDTKDKVKTVEKSGSADSKEDIPKKPTEATIVTKSDKGTKTAGRDKPPETKPEHEKEKPENKGMVPNKVITTVASAESSKEKTDGSESSSKDEETAEKEGASGNQSSEKEDHEESQEKPSSEDTHKVETVVANRMLNEQLTAKKSDVKYKPEASRGAIIALALGLSITAMLLMFVGCRLRTVKHRLRKGRPMQTNEADYLINGMYL